MGHDKSQVMSRATGPKTFHPGRTLVFVPPHEYKGRSKKPHQQQSPRVPSLQPQRSNVHIQALSFDVMEPKRIKGVLSTPSRVQYHSLVGPVKHAVTEQQHKHSKMSADVSVLPMEVINSPRTSLLTASVAS